MASRKEPLVHQKGTPKKKTLDLGKHRDFCINKWKSGKKSIEIEGRKFTMYRQHLNNVPYLVVRPKDGGVPCANFILDESKFRAEMERRGAELKK